MSKEISQARLPAITAASILFYVTAVGWPIATTPVIMYMVRERAYLRPYGTFEGFAGPWKALGMDTMIGTLLLFTVFNLPGYWLWKSHQKGGILGIIFLAVSSVFWWGFALPIPPLVGLLHIGLLAGGWKSLKGETS